MAALRQKAGEPALQVEIQVSCSDLVDKDVTSRSDPCCVLHMQSGSHWSEIGRTENVKNSLNPQFAKSFELDYYFEQVQKLRFRIYDLDNKTTTLSDDDFLGELNCTLGEVVSGSPFSRKLLHKSGKQFGKSIITLKANEMAKTRDVLTLTFKAQKLDKKDLMGKSDPFLELSRQGPDGSWQVVHRTEVIKNDLNPSWRPFLVRTSKLNISGNYSAPILVSCNDYDSDGSHDVIGTFTTSIEELMKASKTQLSWPCVNPKKTHKKGYQNSGTVILTSCLVSKDYSFLDFIFGGLQINFTVAVDFTASNGNPKSSDSLHYYSPQYPNQYMSAIQGVGNVIQDYDSDQMFPALGFGAKIPPHQALSHEFALNFNPGNPFCAGIRGVLDAYMYCLSQVQLYGPTHFAPVIRHVAKFAEVAKRESGAKNYFILLILTDGAITDVDTTIESIVYASTLPMSIIIIGVGNADFSTMDMLDADNGRLRDMRGNVSSRDIVQFVPFQKQIQPAELARLVLAEVPRQVCDYYRDNHIIPGTGTRQTLSTGPAGQPPLAPAGPQGPGPCPPGSVPNQPGPGQYPPGQQPGQYPPGQPGQQPGQYPQGQYPGQPGQQPGQYSSGQPGQQPGQYPHGQYPGQPGQQPGQYPGQPGQQTGQYPPGQYPPGQYSGQPGQQSGQSLPGQYPGQPGQYPLGQPGQYPGQYPAGQPGQHPGQPGQYPGQPGQYPGQPGQYPPGQYPGQPGQYPQGQPGQYPQGQPSQYHGQPGQYPQGQPGQYPTGQPGQYSGQPGQYPQGQPGQYPQGQPGQYPGQHPGQQPGQYPQGQPVQPSAPGADTRQTNECLTTLLGKQSQ